MERSEQREWLNKHRAEHRESIIGLALKIGIPGHVLRRFLDKGTRPAYYNQQAINKFIEKN